MGCYHSNGVNIIEYISRSPGYFDLMRNKDALFGKYRYAIKAADDAFLELLFHNISIPEKIEAVRSKKKQLLVDALKEMIGWFPQFSEFPIMVYIFGSYARSSNRLYSDIDLNFYYPDIHFEEMFPIEELICICLQELFNLSGREKVHSMGCLPLIRNYQFSPEPEFSLIFEEYQEINYRHNRFSLDVMNEIFNMTREIPSAIAYLNSNDGLTKVVEWNASIDLIYNHTDYMFDNFLNSSDRIVSLPEFKECMKAISEARCREYLVNMDFDIRPMEGVTVADFKNKFKTKPFVALYSLFALVRLVLLEDKYNLGYLRIKKYFDDLNLRRVLGDKNVERLITSYYQYYIFVSRIEHIFHTNAYELSSHITNEINQHIFVQYEELFGSQFADDALENVRNIFSALYQAERSLANYLNQ